MRKEVRPAWPAVEEQTLLQAMTPDMSLLSLTAFLLCRQPRFLIYLQPRIGSSANPFTFKMQEMSIASSPPLDLDPAEDLTAEDVILHSTEFTKVRATTIMEIQLIEQYRYILFVHFHCEGDEKAAPKTWGRGSREK